MRRVGEVFSGKKRKPTKISFSSFFFSFPLFHYLVTPLCFTPLFFLYRALITSLQAVGGLTTLALSSFEIERRQRTIFSFFI